MKERGWALPCAIVLSWSVWTGAAIRDTAFNATQSDETRLPPWKSFSEWPPGATRRELYGDPSRGGSFMYVRIPAGYTMPFHWHTAVERIYLQEGAMESQLPSASRKALNEGGALLFPGGRVHSIACVGTHDCLFYLSMTGAVDIHWVPGVRRRPFGHAMKKGNDLRTPEHAMDDPNRNKTTSGTQCWTLYKGGRQMSLLVTDLEGGGFELKLTRSDGATRSVHLFRVREDAMAEVEDQLRNYIAHGWAIHGDRQ